MCLPCAFSESSITLGQVDTALAVTMDAPWPHPASRDKAGYGKLSTLELVGISEPGVFDKRTLGKILLGGCFGRDNAASSGQQR